MVSGPRLEALVRRLDRALVGVERDAIRRLVSALRLSERQLERTLQQLYVQGLEQTATASMAYREAQARVILAQVRASLDVTANSGAGSVFDQLIRGSYAAGADNALAMLSAYDAALVSASSFVRADVAVRATNAAARLARHGTDFALKAEQLIIDGVIRGQGWGRTARELRRETGVTLWKAEQLVRTESITASDTARRENYQANGVEYVQRMATMDDRVCFWCADRAGNVFRVEDAPVALHPNDRCYNAPWKPEWAEAGLVDEEWFRKHRAEALQKAEAAGEKRRTGPAPFERMEGREPPQAVWSP